MHAVTVEAFAKINLTLKVLGKRSDGFHDVRTVLQTIDVSDRIRCVTRADRIPNPKSPILSYFFLFLSRAVLILRSIAERSIESPSPASARPHAAAASSKMPSLNNASPR